MKKYFFVSLICSFVVASLNAQTTSFDNLNANPLTNKSITWTSSNYGSGFGHRIINSDPGGLTLLNFQGRHNTGSWSNIMSLTSNGNVGIGTTNPLSKMHINQDGSDGLRFSRDGHDSYGLLVAGAKGLFIKNRTDSRDEMVFDGNGNVGIGTSAPMKKLHISNGSSGGNTHAFSDFVIEDNDHVMMNLLAPSNKMAYYGFSDTNDDYVGGIQYDNSSDKMTFRVNNHAADMVIKSDGNIGIGTTNPDAKLRIQGGKSLARFNTEEDGFFEIQATRSNSQSLATSLKLSSQGHIVLDPNAAGTSGNVGIGTTTPDSKLTVKGKIHTEEVKVDLSVPGPDYVFKDDYNLKPLKEVKSYIDEHGHLENIPSAKEMEADGIELGIMNMKLLEKIEELTLYTIEQEKKLNKQEHLNKTLLQRLEKIEALLKTKTN